MRQEIVYRESSSRELGEKAIFRFLVKLAAIVLVGMLEWLIFSNIPANMQPPMKAVIYFVLGFTMTMLFIAILCESRVVRMHATILFSLGAVALITGLVIGAFPVS